jgi:hypothetical protein
VELVRIGTEKDGPRPRAGAEGSRRSEVDSCFDARLEPMPDGLRGDLEHGHEAVPVQVRAQCRFET